VEVVPGDHDVPSRFVGGSLLTLLYMAQLAVISQDPWFSTIHAPDEPDHLAFDLDPMPGVAFGRVRDVARWVHDELEKLDIPHALKTSGASGLYIYVPVLRGTTYESGRLFAQIVATVVAAKHPTVATVERSVDVRGQKVYIDYLQNVHGKTLATAYSVRASEFAGVSTPITWKELDDAVKPQDFTMTSMLDRLPSVDVLWAGLRASGGIDLRSVLAAWQR
jgi:bifunctional non-homologous end joining protein LigD